MKFIFTFCVMVALIAALFIFKGNKWEKYYQNKLYQPPKELLVQAVSLFPKEGTAIDLGCGIGNDTLFLLQKNWKVCAIDKEPKAFHMLKKRRDFVPSERLSTICSAFEKIVWRDIPKVDLILASYALPFCSQESFQDVWNQLRDKMIPSGRFVGHFFGTNYSGFSKEEMKRMCFFTKDQVLSLFADFEMEFFKESEQDETSGTGAKIHSHIFEVIAKKK